MFRRQSRLILLALVLQASISVADEPAGEEEEESRWRLGAALGYGQRTNPLIQSDDIPIVVDLDIAWFGDHFFFDNGDLGLTFADNDAVTASLVARFNSDRVFFGNTGRVEGRSRGFDAVFAAKLVVAGRALPRRKDLVEFKRERGGELIQIVQEPDENLVA